MGAFAHLDPSEPYIYMGHTVVYGFEVADDFMTEGAYCFWAKVKNGYVCDTPESLPWARGQHITTLAKMGIKNVPLRLASATGNPTYQ